MCEAEANALANPELVGVWALVRGGVFPKHSELAKLERFDGNISTLAPNLGCVWAGALGRPSVWGRSLLV